MSDDESRETAPMHTYVNPEQTQKIDTECMIFRLAHLGQLLQQDAVHVYIETILVYISMYQSIYNYL